MTLIGLSAQRAETKIRILDMTGTYNILENNKGEGREVRENEPMLAIDKLEPSPIIKLLVTVYES